MFSENNFVMGSGSETKISRSSERDPVLKKAEIDFMKAIEQKNLERVKRLDVISKKNRITGAAIGATVVGIYLYSMYAVQQETFLDDFNEPAKILKE